MTQVVNLRERQTQLSRDAILDAAVALFTRDGYAKSTVQNIADAAGVGVATIFRHFHSKIGVYTAIARRDTHETFAEMTEIVEDPPGDPADAILALMLAGLSLTEKPVLKIRGQPRFWLLLPTGHSEVDKLVNWAEAEVRRLVSDLLVHFVGKGQVPSENDIGHMTEILFQVFNSHYIEWNLDLSLGLDEVEDNLRQRVPLIFKAWRC